MAPKKRAAADQPTLEERTGAETVTKKRSRKGKLDKPEVQESVRASYWKPHASKGRFRKGLRCFDGQYRPPVICMLRWETSSGKRNNRLRGHRLTSCLQLADCDRRQCANEQADLYLSLSPCSTSGCSWRLVQKAPGIEIWHRSTAARAKAERGREAAGSRRRRQVGCWHLGQPGTSAHTLGGRCCTETGL